MSEPTTPSPRSPGPSLTEAAFLRGVTRARATLAEHGLAESNVSYFQPIDPETAQSLVNTGQRDTTRITGALQRDGFTDASLVAAVEDHFASPWDTGSERADLVARIDNELIPRGLRSIEGITVNAPPERGATFDYGWRVNIIVEDAARESAPEQVSPRQRVRDAVERGIARAEPGHPFGNTAEDLTLKRVEYRTKDVFATRDTLKRSVEEARTELDYALDDYGPPDGWTIKSIAEIERRDRIHLEGIERQRHVLRAAEQVVAEREDMTVETLAIVEDLASVPWYPWSGETHARIANEVNDLLQAEGLPTFEEAQAHPKALWSATREDYVATEYSEPKEAPDVDLTSPHLEALWIEQTATARAHLADGNVQAVRHLLEEIDENLVDFDDGGYPPDSDEMYGIYQDAVVRAALPYGEPPVALDEVARQLHNAGIDVPPFDPADVAQRTGIRPLTHDELARHLDQPAQPPAGVEDVAAARLSVRRALVSISEDGEAARGHLTAANAALGSAIGTLRPDTNADVTRAHESVKQATESVTALTATADTIAKTDTPDVEQAARERDAEVTIYSTPGCAGCFATKRALDKAGVQYDDIDLSERPDLVETFKAQGLGQAPIVETKDGDRWTGYQPGKLKEHGLDYRSRQNRAAGTDSSAGVER